MLKTQESVIELLGNGSNIGLKTTQKYAAILGEFPSKGAKSPILWNKAFEGLKISAKMYPFDVAADRLESVVKSLRIDKSFMGGAVTMPYKVSILPYLDRIEPEATRIGAVNCIFREGDNLIGTNTDGAGALESLKPALGELTLSGKTVAILGTGGAGQAVAAYVASAVGPKGKLLLCNRSKNRLQDVGSRLKDLCTVELLSLPAEPQQLAQASVVINCSSVGFETLRQDSRGAFTLRPYTPLGPVDETVRVPSGSLAAAEYMVAARNAIEKNWSASLETLARLRHAFIFDIVYQPRQTFLLNLAACFGIQTLNGVAMNLEQAVIAFHKTVRMNGQAFEPADIRQWMVQVW